MFVEAVELRRVERWAERPPHYPRPLYVAATLSLTSQPIRQDLVVAVSEPMADYLQGLVGDYLGDLEDPADDRPPRLVLVDRLYRGVRHRSLWRADRVETERGDVYGSEIPKGYKGAVKAAHELIAELP